MVKVGKVVDGVMVSGSEVEAGRVGQLGAPGVAVLMV